MFVTYSSLVSMTVVSEVNLFFKILKSGMDFSGLTRAVKEDP